MIADALAAVDRLRAASAESVAGTTPRSGPKALVRGASAFYGHPIIGAAIRSGADVSVTLRLTKTVKRAVGDAVAGSSLRVEEIFEVGVLVGQVVSFRPGFLCEADDVELVRRAQRCSSRTVVAWPR